MLDKTAIKKAISPKEISLHMSVADSLRKFCKSDWRWTHFPSGEHRDIRTAAKLKQMGVQKGWPDFILIGPCGNLYFLELKRTGAKLTGEQEEFRLWCVSRNISYAVAYDIDQALVALRFWRCLKIL